MKNILSYKIGTQMSGQEINDFCQHQILTHGSKEKDAKRLYAHNYNNDKIYELKRLQDGPGANQSYFESKRQIIFVRVKEEE